MKFRGRALMSLSVMAAVGWVIITSLSWPFRSAFFILVVGSVVFFLATVETFLSFFGKESLDGNIGEGVDRSSASKRTIVILVWVLGFFSLIVLFGFPVAVPLFLFLYLKLHGETWGIALGLTAAGWASFYGLFVRLLNLPFPEGIIKGWLKITSG